MSNENPEWRRSVATIAFSEAASIQRKLRKYQTRGPRLSDDEEANLRALERAAQVFEECQKIVEGLCKLSDEIVTYPDEQSARKELKLWTDRIRFAKNTLTSLTAPDS